MPHMCTIACSRAIEVTQYHLPVEPPLVNPKEARISDFNTVGDALLEQLLAAPVELGTKPSSTLEDALHIAVRSWDRWATQRLWQKIQSHEYKPKDGEEKSCAIRNMPITDAVLHFIIFKVQDPTLVLEFCRLGTGVLGTKQKQHLSRTELTAMTAAIMYTVAYVLRAGKEQNAKQERPFPVEEWQAVLKRLYPCISPYPSPMWIRGNGGGSEPKSKTLLQLAVHCCSYTQSDELGQVLHHCNFSYNAVADAFEEALKPTVQGDATLVSTIVALYRQLMRLPRPIQSETNATAALKRAWGYVVGRTTSWKEVSVYTGTTDSMLIPVGGTQLLDTRHPDLFVQCLDVMLECHDTLDPDKGDKTRSRFRPLIWYAMDKAVCSCYAGHMLERLIEYVDSHEWEPEYLTMDGFVTNLFMHHSHLYPKVEPHVQKWSSSELNPKFVPHFEWAVDQLIIENRRDSLRQVLRILGRVPKSSKPQIGYTLNNYIQTMCKPLGFRKSMELGSAAYKVYCEEVKSDFESFLSMGQFSYDELKHALALASGEGHGIATAVLLGPPYNVPMPEEDQFVAHILEEVLAPGNEAARDVEKQFTKRARTSL